MRVLSTSAITHVWSAGNQHLATVRQALAARPRDHHGVVHSQHALLHTALRLALSVL